MLFYAFGLAPSLSALLAVTRKNAVSAAMWLVLMFFGLAGIYVVLEAYFVAAVQILVYAGAIMVLFLFVIMLLDLRSRGAGVAHGPALEGPGRARRGWGSSPRRWSACCSSHTPGRRPGTPWPTWTAGPRPSARRSSTAGCSPSRCLHGNVPDTYAPAGGKFPDRRPGDPRRRGDPTGGKVNGTEMMRR